MLLILPDKYGASATNCFAIIRYNCIHKYRKIKNLYIHIYYIYCTNHLFYFPQELKTTKIMQIHVSSCNS